MQSAERAATLCLLRGLIILAHLWRFQCNHQQSGRRLMLINRDGFCASLYEESYGGHKENVGTMGEKKIQKNGRGEMMIQMALGHLQRKVYGLSL